MKIEAKANNNFVSEKPFTKLHIPLNRRAKNINVK